MPQHTVLNDVTYQPYNRYVDSHGLRIFSLDGVSESFIKKLSVTYDAMHATNSLVNTESRATFKATLENNYVFQRVGVNGPDHYGGGGKLPFGPQSGNYAHNQTDFIWEGTTRTAASQTNEVIEHLLHTVTAVGFNILYPEWKWNDSSSSINLAMQQAIDGGYYDISSYASVTDPEDHMKTVATEFAYWLVLAEWEYFDVAGMSANNTEFTLRTASDISNNLPLAHQLYLNTFAKVFSVPDKALIQSVYSTETPYVFSTTDIAGSIIADILYGNELDNTIRGDAGNDTIFADGGSDTIQGGLGLDTIQYTLTRANYTLTNVGESSASVLEIIEGTTDSINTAERLSFSDVNVALDIAANPGEAYRLYKAAFDRAPDLVGLGFWIKALDNGETALKMALEFNSSPEFISLYGANNSNDDYLNLLYNNVLDRDGDAGGHAFWLGHLDAATVTREKLLIDFSESIENKTNVIELIASGIDYTAYVS